jgi:hypothetical protein
MIKKIFEELKVFGFKHFLYRVVYKIFKSEKYFSLFLMEREKKYNKLSSDQYILELQRIYSLYMRRKLDLNNVNTFTEKIQWLKIYDNTDIKMKLADKIAVTEWVKDKIGEKYLVPKLGKWNNFDEINFEQLPNRFCLKMNHGSSMNYLVEDKNKMCKKEAQRNFYWWLKRPFWALSFEPQYRYMPRIILAEKYIEELDGNLYDYKIHCFNGTPKFIQCIGDRNLKKHTGYQKNYDIEWNELEWTFEDYPKFTYCIPKPSKLTEMLDIATTLSSGFIYVRVDLYEIDDKVIFGEMTFTPASGIYPYRGSWTAIKDKELGDLMVLPDKI